MKSEKRISSSRKKEKGRKSALTSRQSHTPTQHKSPLRSQTVLHPIRSFTSTIAYPPVRDENLVSPYASNQRVDDESNNRHTSTTREKREATAGSHFRSSLSLVFSPSSSRLLSITDLLHLLRDRTSYHGPIDQEDRSGSLIIHDQRQS